MMPTQDEINQAIIEGREAFGLGLGTHTWTGEHRCPYKDDRIELQRAWLQGYDAAAKRTGRTI